MIIWVSTLEMNNTHKNGNLNATRYIGECMIILVIMHEMEYSNVEWCY